MRFYCCGNESKETSSTRKQETSEEVTGARKWWENEVRQTICSLFALLFLFIHFLLESDGGDFESYNSTQEIGCMFLKQSFVVSSCGERMVHARLSSSKRDGKKGRVAGK